MNVSQAINKGLRLLSPAYRFSKVLKELKPTPIDPQEDGKGQKPKLLFFTWYTNDLLISREVFLAKACEWRGSETTLLHCDLPIGPTERGKRTTRVGLPAEDVTGGAYLLDKLEQNHLPASKYYTPLNRDELAQTLGKLSPQELEQYEYRSINIGELVVASSIRTTLGLGPEWDESSFRKLFTDRLITAMEVADIVEKALNDYQPDRLVMSHGAYVTWGVAYRMARQRGIDVCVYNGSYRINTVRFYKNNPNAPFPEAEWPKFRDIPLTQQEEQWAESYFQSRSDQKNETVNVFDRTDDATHVQEFIKKAKADGRRVTALFTNMSWDSYAFSKPKVFKDMIEWVNETITHLGTRSDISAILKIHPAENFFGVPEKYRLRNHLVDIPDNVLLLTEHDKVKPFTFFKDLDFGMINISTVAIEMALLGIPVLTNSAGGHYEGRGFTADPETKEDYYRWIDRLIENPASFTIDREMALRYLYYRFYREAIPFEPTDVAQQQLAKVNISTYDDLRPGHFPGLDTIADGIVFDKPFIYEEAPN